MLKLFTIVNFDSSIQSSWIIIGIIHFDDTKTFYHLKHSNPTENSHVQIALWFDSVALYWQKVRHSWQISNALTNFLTAYGCLSSLLPLNQLTYHINAWQNPSFSPLDISSTVNNDTLLSYEMSSIFDSMKARETEPLHRWAFQRNAFESKVYFSMDAIYYKWRKIVKLFSSVIANNIHA